MPKLSQLNANVCKYECSTCHAGELIKFYFWLLLKFINS